MPRTRARSPIAVRRVAITGAGVLLALSAHATSIPEIEKLGTECRHSGPDACAKLEDIAKNDSHEAFRARAVRKLIASRSAKRNEAFLELVATTDTAESVREAALSKLNPRLIARIAENHSNADVRRTAVRNLDRQELLGEIATGDRDPSVRGAAVGRLADQELLLRIATNDSHPAVRAAAVSKLAGQELLARIATHDRDPAVRAAAAARLADQDLLERIATSDRDPSVRGAAVNRLSDRSVLEQIATDDSDQAVGEVAIAALSRLAEKKKRSREAPALRFLRVVAVLSVSNYLLAALYYRTTSQHRIGFGGYALSLPLLFLGWAIASPAAVGVLAQAAWRTASHLRASPGREAYFSFPSGTRSIQGRWTGKRGGFSPEGGGRSWGATFWDDEEEDVLEAVKVGAVARPIKLRGLLHLPSDEVAPGQVISGSFSIRFTYPVLQGAVVAGGTGSFRSETEDLDIPCKVRVVAPSSFRNLLFSFVGEKENIALAFIWLFPLALGMLLIYAGNCALFRPLGRGRPPGELDPGPPRHPRRAEPGAAR